MQPCVRSKKTRIWWKKSFDGGQINTNTDKLHYVRGKSFFFYGLISLLYIHANYLYILFSKASLYIVLQELGTNYSHDVKCWNSILFDMWGLTMPASAETRFYFTWCEVLKIEFLFLYIYCFLKLLSVLNVLGCWTVQAGEETVRCGKLKASFDYLLLLKGLFGVCRSWVVVYCVCLS